MGANPNNNSIFCQKEGGDVAFALSLTVICIQIIVTVLCSIRSCISEKRLKKDIEAVEERRDEVRQEHRTHMGSHGRKESLQLRKNLKALQQEYEVINPLSDCDEQHTDTNIAGKRTSKVVR